MDSKVNPIQIRLIHQVCLVMMYSKKKQNKTKKKLNLFHLRNCDIKQTCKLHLSRFGFNSRSVALFSRTTCTCTLYMDLFPARQLCIYSIVANGKWQIGVDSGELF